MNYPQYYKCDECGAVISNLDVGFSPSVLDMRCTCGGTWRPYDPFKRTLAEREADILLDAAKNGQDALDAEVHDAYVEDGDIYDGQHGGADYIGVVSRTEPASPSEFRALKKELEEIGYRLKVFRRLTPTMRKEFEEALKAYHTNEEA